MYWWSQEIRDHQKEAITARRIKTRLTKRLPAKAPELLKITELADILRKDLKKMINKAKKQAWKNICDELENDIWGQGYQIATRSAGRQDSPCNPTQEQKLAWCKELFPAAEIRTSIIRTNKEPIIKFTVEELEKAASEIKTKLAAGPDGISP